MNLRDLTTRLAAASFGSAPVADEPPGTAPAPWLARLRESFSVRSWSRTMDTRENQIAESEAEHAALVARRAQLSLDALGRDSADAQKDLAKVESKIAEMDRTLARLGLARQEAARRQADERATEAAKRHAAQREAVRKAARQLGESVRAIGVATDELATAFANFHRATETLARALPGVDLTNQAMTARGVVRGHVERQLHVASRGLIGMFRAEAPRPLGGAVPAPDAFVALVPPLPADEIGAA